MDGLARFDLNQAGRTHLNVGPGARWGPVWKSGWTPWTVFHTVTVLLVVSFLGFGTKKGSEEDREGLGLGCRTGLMYAELFGIEWEVYNYKERGVAVKRKPCGNSAC